MRQQLGDHATLTRPRSTTPATTLASNGGCRGATAAGTLRAPAHPTNSDTKQLSAEMTATLFAQLEERAAVDLVADIVRGPGREQAKRPGSGGRVRDDRGPPAPGAPYPRRLVPAEPEQRPPGDGTGQDRTTPVDGLTPTGSYRFANRKVNRS